MATELINTSFKTKCGTVESVENLIPEKGAIVFDDETGTVKVGDGFNWRPLPIEAFSAIALSLQTPTSTPLTLATPLAPYTFFDTVDYQLGTDIVPTIGDTITIGANMDADSSIQFQALSDVPQNSILLELLVGAVVASSRELDINKANQWITFDWTARGSLASADVLTIRITAEKSCNFGLRNLTYGLQQVT